MSTTGVLVPESSSTVWDSIWRLALERGLRVGDQLPSIRELADRLEVKQTTVRDALLKAESMGLVKIMPRAGAFLRASSSAPNGTAASCEAAHADFFRSALMHHDYNLFHLFDARRLIEIELAGQAAERRRLEDLLPVRRALESMLHVSQEVGQSQYVEFDIRFHIEIARLSSNLVLFAVQRTFMELLRPHLIEIPRDSERRASTDGSHIAIYEALVCGDPEKARTEMRNHLSLAYDSMLQDIRELPMKSDK